MVTVSSKAYHSLPFEDYLKMPGYSFSGLSKRGAIIEPTEKMKLGTRVHNYLLDAADFDYEDLRIVKPLAIAVKRVLGDSFRLLKTEMAVTANMEHEGFRLSYKGRLDMHYPGVIVVDLKISENKNVDFFGYVDQVSGYCMADESPRGVIVKLHPKTLETTIINAPITTRWWEHQIKTKGEVI